MSYEADRVHPVAGTDPIPRSGEAAPGNVAMINVTACPGCALPAIVSDRFTLESTDGPIEHVRTRCIAGHPYLLSLSSDMDACRCPAAR
ncbi:MAG TPA: hypothetical protein VIY28_11035 [Pseudonocardiaceae bacterium]